MRIRGGLILTALLLAAGAASADWLVMRDGTQVETDGPWTVKGRLIVFTNADGALASLRSSEVDLEASELATEAAVEEAAALVRAREEEASMPVEAPAVAPVLVLTDADVAHVDPDDLEASEGDDPAGESLRVISWEQETSDDGNGVIVTGILRNDGAEVASSIKLSVQVLDPDGEILGTQEAQLSSTSLNTAELLNFRVLFADVPGFDTARFDVTSRSFRTTPPVGLSPDPEVEEDSRSAIATAES